MPSEAPATFADLLRHYRVAAGLTQEVLAERAALSVYGIQKLERGVTRPYRDTIQRLVSGLQLAPEAEARFRAAGAPLPRHHAERAVAPSRLRAPGGVAEPAEATRAPVAARRPALPGTLSSFVGREQELAELGSSIESVRLLTLTGAGGVGKTRLALQLAQHIQSRFRDGAVFVMLAAIQDATLVVPTIAHLLGLEGDGARAPREAVREALVATQLLLVLDNFEHVLGAATAVTELLESCPGVKVLVTSRAALRVRGEQEFVVPPLRLPDRARSADPTTLSEYDAVRLFIERARSVEPHFMLTDVNAAAVAEICRRVDGLPLAIELAAARSRLLSPLAMLPRLERRLNILIGGARDMPTRHQTLRATIAWSYDLLNSAEQKLFRRLSVFVGGFTIPAARSVAGGQTTSGVVPRADDRAPRPYVAPSLDEDVLQPLESLLAMSLVQKESRPDGEERFSMLETMREFALERLAESGADRALRRRHASAYLAFAERARQQFFGPQQSVWLARLEAEHANLRAAFDTWQAQQEPERALRLLEALHWFWLVHGHVTEGRERAAQVAMLAATTSRPELQAEALDHGSTLAFHQGDYVVARALAEQGLALWQRLGQTHRLPHLLVDLAAAESRQGDTADARAHLDQSLVIARQLGDLVSYSRSLNDLANLAQEQAQYARARTLYQEALALARQHDDMLGVATALNNLAVVARDQGERNEARQLFEESIAIRRAVGDRHGLALTLANLADVLSQSGDHHYAQTLLSESLTIERDLGAGPGIAFVLERLAGVAAAQGQARRALRLAGAAAAQRASLGVAAPRGAQLMLDQRLGPAREALDQATAALAWAEGKALPRDEAVAYVLTRTDDL